MLRQKSNLTQMGAAIAILGVAVYGVVMIGNILLPLAQFAILIGIVLAVAGLVMPGRSSY